MRRVIIHVCLALMVVANPVAAREFSELIIFSGSLSDTGNFASINGDLPPPFFENRSSNGPVAVDVFAARLGFTAKPSLHLIGPAVGNNFAVLGALAIGSGPADLFGQLRAYLEPRNNQADPNALYFVFIGGNDVILAATEPDDARAKQILRGAVRAIERAIRTLVDAGARTVFAPNFIDLGIAPKIRDAGIAERTSQLSRFYNDIFEKMLDRLERSLDFELIRFDFDRLVTNTIAHADELGFTNTTDSCLALLASGQCDFEHFIFFNDVFPTAKVHDYIGNALTFAVINRDQDRCVRLCQLEAKFGLSCSKCERECRAGNHSKSASVVESTDD